ncbi:MAG: SulP family inorganic anion transporter [Pirellula sp.]|jgi:MFS superfamily sulfate permease-like transporter|nr:SulP family inorganic anion transporter [Pirellula sp.]
MNNATNTNLSKGSDIPRGDFQGARTYFRADITAGFLVFLIAMPLCLAISIASGFPPLAGIFTAFLGAVFCSLLSNSEMTIKGPAAGLIVIVMGCVQDFGGDGMAGGFTQSDLNAYQAALAVGVVAAILQIIFGLLRGGILGDFFPGAAVHGMLAAIGIIIMLKQFPVALGVTARGEPLELLKHLPDYIMELNPAIASIGLVSLAIMFLWPWITSQWKILKSVPSQLIVLAVAVPMGIGFDLLHESSYTMANHEYPLGEQFLVSMPKEMFGLFKEIQLPAFEALATFKAWKWVFLFFIIGSLESLLSAKAIESLDPYHRKTNLNRDLLAVGVANLASSFVGGLPMISEIVRSRANIDNGAKTRFANLWHGIFLLLCVALFPTILHLIPLSALAAMLVYTGFRLAHPREFVNVYRIGREQLLIFVVTIIGVLATDLLLGILIGVVLKILLHVVNGVPLSSIFKPFLEVEQIDDNNCLIRAHKSAIFSNWIPFRRQIEDLGLVQRQNVTIDFSNTKLVDSSTLEKLHDMQVQFSSEGLELTIVGLDSLRATAGHAMSTRVGGLVRMRRMTVITNNESAPVVESICLQHDLVSYVAQKCRGKANSQWEQADKHASLTDNSSLGDQSAQRPLQTMPAQVEEFVRIEVVAPNRVCESIVGRIRAELPTGNSTVVYTEAIDMMLRPNEAPMKNHLQHG